MCTWVRIIAQQNAHVLSIKVGKGFFGNTYFLDSALLCFLLYLGGIAWILKSLSAGCSHFHLTLIIVRDMLLSRHEMHPSVTGISYLLLGNEWILGSIHLVADTMPAAVAVRNEMIIIMRNTRNRKSDMLWIWDSLRKLIEFKACCACVRTRCLRLYGMKATSVQKSSICLQDLRFPCRVALSVWFDLSLPFTYATLTNYSLWRSLCMASSSLSFSIASIRAAFPLIPTIQLAW